MRAILFFLPTIFFMFGCAAPSQVKDKAASILNPPCYEYFTNGSLGGYQLFAHQFSPMVALAYAQDFPGGPAVCWGANKHEVLTPTWDRVETLAIARCEDAKIKANSTIKAACKIFARNNDIVIDKNESIKLQ